MNCKKCGRTMKNPAPSGFGPRCLIAVLGAKAPRIKREPRKADSATPDLFSDEMQERDYMGRVAELIGGISLEVA